MLSSINQSINNGALMYMQHRNTRHTWHGGFIHESEIWVKLGGDRGGGIFTECKCSNSVLNICVFCCFMTGDSTHNLHVALHRYKLQVNKLQWMKWRCSTFIYMFTTQLIKFCVKQGLHSEGFPVWGL